MDKRAEISGQPTNSFTINHAHSAAGIRRYVPDSIESGLLVSALKESIRPLIEAGCTAPWKGASERVEIRLILSPSRLDSILDELTNK